MSNLAENIAETDSRSREEFLADVLAGLSTRPKTLPCKYFYDERGSILFEQICELEEYYITRTELALLSDIGAEVAELVGEGVTIIEPGSGAGVKVQILLDALLHPRKFIPLEISLDALEASTKELKQKFPQLRVIPHQGDFTDQKDLKKLPLLKEKSERRLVFFPGSTIGNFTRKEAVEVLNNLRILAGENGLVLVGVDLLKDRNRLLDAYDDHLGITADFNKNLLVRINRELDANFDFERGFDHRAVFNEQASRIEMHLVSASDQSVEIGDQKVEFDEGESIHTENSHKYSEQMVVQMVTEANLQVVRDWTDEGGDFALFLLEPLLA
ncbi:MAG: L-histidine N(alpha)-methyltransferase [Porticoccaceae bacterium]|jgi:dimethylhistidine N-methyltransferase|nr:L-histidine N(alpha)-methyltransferase [Porticoccaceae bacterium]